MVDLKHSYKVGDSVLVHGLVKEIYPGTGSYLVDVGITSCSMRPERMRPMEWPKKPGARHVAPPEPVTLTDEERDGLAGAALNAAGITPGDERPEHFLTQEAIDEGDWYTITWDNANDGGKQIGYEISAAMLAWLTEHGFALVRREFKQ